MKLRDELIVGLYVVGVITLLIVNFIIFGIVDHYQDRLLETLWGMK